MSREAFVPFEPVDHTADLAFVARGRTLEELFTNAALGMLHLLCDPARIKPRAEEAIELDGEDPEELLVCWLQEILYRWEVGKRVFHDVEVRRVEQPMDLNAAPRGSTSSRGEDPPSLPEDGPCPATTMGRPHPRWRLQAVARGERWIRDRHEILADIKAATYHGLEITREQAGERGIYRVQVVLDT